MLHQVTGLITSDVPQKEKHLARRPLGNLDCWSLQMEKMSMFPMSSHSQRIRNMQSASSKCWYKLILISYLLVRIRKKLQPRVPSPLLECSLLTSRTTTGSPVSMRSGTISAWLFQRCPDFGAALLNSLMIEGHEDTLGNTRGKQP